MHNECVVRLNLAKKCTTRRRSSEQVSWYIRCASRLALVSVTPPFVMSSRTRGLRRAVKPEPLNGPILLAREDDDVAVIRGRVSFSFKGHRIFGRSRAVLRYCGAANPIRTMTMTVFGD